MGVLIVFVLFMMVIITLITTAIIVMDEFSFKNLSIGVVIITLLIGISTIFFRHKPVEPTSHVVLKSTVWKDITFSEVMKIEYDIHSAPWWTVWETFSKEPRNIIISREE